MLGFFQVSAISQKVAYIQRNGVGIQPFVEFAPNYPFHPDCAACVESPYRTARRPIEWKD